MREPALGLKTSLLNGGSFRKRIHENLLSVWRLPRVPLPAVHAPLELLDEQRAYAAPAAQFGSTLVHMLLCAALVWSVAQPSLKSTRLGWTATSLASYSEMAGYGGCWRALRDEQWMFSRVRTAQDKEQTLKQLFSNKGLSYPPNAILLRAFKKEGTLELWTENAAGTPIRW